jgi:hypothetical protein
MGRERAVDHHRTTLDSHNYSCNFHNQVILQSVSSFEIRDVWSPTGLQKVLCTIPSPDCACQAMCPSNLLEYLPYH